MNTLLNYPGAKWGMAAKIVSMMPKHRSYVEPFFGSGAVLFNKPPSAIETVNDIDGDIVNFFRVLREQPEELARLIALTPYSRDVFNDAHENKGMEPLDRAYRFAIRSKMGHGFKTYQKTGFKIDVYARERSYCVACWNRLPKDLVEAAVRLKGVQIENQPALDVIRKFNHDNVLIYADPPYLLNTRSGKQYRHEMDEQDHVELLEALLSHKGYVILSGYASEMYDRELKSWTRITQKAYNQNADPRTEVLWCNFDVPELFVGGVAMEFTHLSLFSGIGGLDLAAEMAGFTTVGQCEWADFPTKVLEKHWPNVPRWRDIRTLTKESFYERTGLHAVDVISGGFPCQPHSLAGKRKGADDERHLWPEFMRVVRELNPRYVVGENVPGLLSTIHDDVCTDLESSGYEVQTLCIPAYAVGAHHERYRVAIIGISKSKPRLQADSQNDTTGTSRPTRECTLLCNRDNLPGTYWAVHKPPVFGMAHGIPGGVDGRMKFKGAMTALGNAVVPQQFFPVFQAIADVERMAGNE